MTYEIISTGSKGNAVVLDGEILIDCGVSWKKLKPYAQKLRLVLLTHVHGDHFKAATVRALHRERPGLRWCCCEWMVEPLLKAGVSKRVIDVVGAEDRSVGWSYVDEINEIYVFPEKVRHNVPNCAWHIRTVEDETPVFIFYATDAATLEGIDATDYDWYFIEANHGEAEIEARIAAKMEAGEFAYEAAARENHMSEEQAMAWLKDNMGANSRFVLLHQHEDRQQGPGNREQEETNHDE